MPTIKPAPHQKGYALLTLTIITISIFLIIFIPLQLILVSNSVSTQIGTDSRVAFYGAETAIHDAIAKTVDTNFTWPENVDDQVIEHLTYGNDGEIQVTRTVTKTDTDSITIIAVSNYKNSQRTMTAQLGRNEATPPVDVAIVIDTSISMDDMSEADFGQDPYGFACDGPNQPKCEPMETARQAAKTLVNTLFSNNTNARVSIIRFSGYAETLISVSSDKAAIDETIDEMTIQGIPGTNIGDGFYKAELELLNAPPKIPYPLRFIVLMSDGSANVKGTTGTFQCIGDYPNPPTIHTPCTHDPNVFDSATQRANSAKNKGYTVYTVGFNLGTLLPPAHQNIAIETLLLSSSNPDQEEHFFNAIELSDLQTIYDTIGAKINESATVQIREIR